VKPPPQPRPPQPRPPRIEPTERPKQNAPPTSRSSTDRVAPRTLRPAVRVGSAVGAPAPPRAPRRAVVDAGSAARFAERAELQRRLTRRRVYRISAVTLILIGLGWLGFFSPAFKVDPARVVITGADAIVDRAAVDKVVVAHAAGIPLPRLNTPALRDRLLEVPGVREARVTRVWPRGLAVLLVTRRPVVAVPTDGAFILLDIDGVQVGRSKDAGGLPAASVPANNPRTLKSVLEVLGGLPPELVGEIATVGADSEDTVTMTLRGGVTVVWGSAEDTPLKIRVLGVLRGADQTKGARVFDVSAPTLPITRS
jgi:cell division protein FtsQ